MARSVPPSSSTGSLIAGLYYPMVIAALTFVVGSLLLKETNHVRIWDEVHELRHDDDTLPDSVGVERDDMSNAEPTV